MPLMYAQNTLQMEWCLDCHRNPVKNLRPTNQVYNMAWEAPSEEHPVWCSVAGAKDGVPTADSVNCVTEDPAKKNEAGVVHAATDAPEAAPSFKKFESQNELGKFLVVEYKIRTPRELSSCEVCHR